LAAGKGSRLYPVTHIIAKPLLPLANKPTLAYAFERLKEIDVYEIGLVVGDNEQSMREFVNLSQKGWHTQSVSRRISLEIVILSCI